MAKFTDNMSGWQKLLLVFGIFGALLAALYFVPTEAGTLMTWIADQLRLLFGGA